MQRLRIHATAPTVTTNITNPAPGTAAAPIEAKVAVKTMLTAELGLSLYQKLAQ